MEMIAYDPRDVMFEPGGLVEEHFRALHPQLESARREVLDDARKWEEGEPFPPEKQPHDAGFHLLPDRLIEDFREQGGRSEVARIKASAARIAGSLENVAILGIGGSYMGARALLEACCHPYYNELSRQARGGTPRIYFEGNNVDNDAVQGLRDLLRSRGEPWGIVVISKSGGTLETAAAFRILLRDLQDAVGDKAEIARRVVPITGSSGKLLELAQALGCDEIHHVPEGVGGRYSIFSAVGLLPAAIMGLDILKLLEGAVAMNEHFRTAPVGGNVVLDYTATCHLMEKHHGCDIRVMSTWGKRLEALGLWYDQLLAESLGKEEKGAMPLTVVNTRDLHSRGQQHQEGKRDKLITNVIVDRVDREPLLIGRSEQNQDNLNELAEKSLPQIMSAAIEGTNQAYREVARPTAGLHLPRLDEHTLGQALQMFMLATVLEGRLTGINPYGQPGVEAYKKNMNAILRG